MFVIEAVVVGLVLIVFGTISSWIVDKMNDGVIESYFPSHYLSMAMALFIAGAMTHTFFEATNLNNKYALYKVNLMNQV